MCVLPEVCELTLPAYTTWAQRVCARICISELEFLCSQVYIYAAFALMLQQKVKPVFLIIYREVYNVVFRKEYTLIAFFETLFATDNVTCKTFSSTVITHVCCYFTTTVDVQFILGQFAYLQ